ncbi:MAG: hypothetical protein ABSE73_22505, partial [Planctomycetota bacterium]
MRRPMLAAVVIFPLLCLPTLRCADEVPATPGSGVGGDADTDDLNLDDNAANAAQGGTLIRLVPFNDPKQDLAKQLLWRTVQGSVAAHTVPVRFWIDGTAVIEPRLRVGAASAEKNYVYPTAGRMKLEPGEHTLTPGNLKFNVTAKGFEMAHPALAAGQGDELLIRCAPVRLESCNEDGAFVGERIRLQLGNDSLLREEASFTALTVWLPVGLKYDSSFGAFAVSADGKIEPAALAQGVAATATGLRLTRAKPGSAGVPPASISAAETAAVRTAGRVRCFLPGIVKPGQALVAAFSRAAYEQEAKEPFALAACACSSAAGVRPVSEIKAPDEKLAGSAAAHCGTAPEDLVWLSLPVPPGCLGAFQFTLTSKAPPIRHTVLISDDPASLWLVPQRMRTAFEQGEEPVFQVLIPNGFKGGEAKVAISGTDTDFRLFGNRLSVPEIGVSPRNRPTDLGALTLPACTEAGFDARLFKLDTRALAPGQYRLWVDSPNGKSQFVPLTIVPAWIERSPFFVHTMSGCTGLWPVSDEGLDILRNSGLEMGTGSGFNTLMDLGLPRINTELAGGPWPAEAAMQPAKNDLLLERLLRHRLRYIEMAVVRTLAFYNESLSYHHSFKPSVDRTVRRMQIFAQQTGEYPSWSGVNYSWFPAWWGYTEGGVPTDAHTKDRNEALAAAVQQAGFADATKEEREWYEKNKAAGDPATREKALAIMHKAVAFWKAREDLAWGKHNKIYNDAIREVRPRSTFTLFDNAGHDLGKRTRALFNDMAAACYESYTDFGEWPMSAAFTTDWARSNLPSKRVWLTVDWGTSAEGQMKSLFHAFGRGLTGGGTPLQEELGLKEIARRGTGMAFLGQYGAIAASATPENRFAILTTAAHQVLRGGQREYDYHALYYHLTRLGCPPVLLADEDVMQSGIPAATKALFLVREEDPLEPKVLEAVQAFQKNGGQVLATSDCLIQVEGATTVPIKIKHIWELSGFAGKIHAEMWEEFEKNIRQSLGAALAKTGVTPLAVADWERGLAVALTAGPVRYVVVIADKKGAPSGVFEPVAGLPVSLEGTGWTVRDLVKQTTLKTEEKDGRSVVAVDLITEPTTILALFKSQPESLTVYDENDHYTLGGQVSFTPVVMDKSGASLYAIPLRLTINDPLGKERETIYGSSIRLPKFQIAAHDLAGVWKATVQELLTGLTGTAEIVVSPAEPKTAIAQVGDVHVVDEAQLRAFAARTSEKWIIVEPGQEKLLPVAQKTMETLTAAGLKARLWQLQPEDFDTLPLRWYPRPYDQARIKLIEAGKLIGYRGNLTAYIDTKTRSHLPEKGGWSDIDPPYMIGSECIVFSGGRLAESLRAVTPWMETPNVPGRGQGRLVAIFSPFLANRMAVAVVANDAAGMAKAAEQLAAICGKTEAATVVSPQAA